MTPPTIAPTAALEAVARLSEAARSGRPCAPVRDLIGDDAALAYTVQSLGIADREADGAARVGRKVGLTSLAVQRQLGVDQPDFGVLLDSMRVEVDGEVPAGALLQGRVEAEVAFVLGSDLPDPSTTLAQARSAVAHAAAALEIVDSRIAGWDITFADTVADNGSSALFVVSNAVLPLAGDDAVEPVSVEMVLTVDGEPASSGSGAACLGDPLEALAWLARTAAGLGKPLRAGDVVLSGALGPMVDVRPGTRVETVLSVDGTEVDRVAVHFAATDGADR
ncbi:MAG: 2-keto-4-pentenoate hydratase [Nocardioides sp.]|nr:2-keto-4-pentenoate hydratase [Nocardioides sp.]